MWYSSIYVLLENFECSLSSLAGYDAIGILSDVPSGDALTLSTCYEELQVGSQFSVEHQWSEFSLDFETSGWDSSFGLSLTNHFTADLGREWRLVTKATEVLLTPWPAENPRAVWMLQNARPPCNQTISNSFSRNLYFVWPRLQHFAVT